MGGITWKFWSLVCLVGVGCASPQSNVLEERDYRVLSEEMIGSLVAGSFLKERTSASAPIVVAVKPVENLTTDIISPGRRKQLQVRIVEAFANREFCAELAMRFDSWDGGDVAGGVTHVLAPIFATATRIETGEGNSVRTESYQLRYVLTNLATRAVEWSDALWFDRQATGLLID